jgi:hypothetical protein
MTQTPARINKLRISLLRIACTTTKAIRSLGSSNLIRSLEMQQPQRAPGLFAMQVEKVLAKPFECHPIYLGILDRKTSVIKIGFPEIVKKERRAHS